MARYKRLASTTEHVHDKNQGLVHAAFQRTLKNLDYFATLLGGKCINVL